LKRWKFVVEDLETGDKWFSTAMTSAKMIAKRKSTATGHTVAVIAVDTSKGESHPQGAYYGKRWRGGAYHYQPKKVLSLKALHTPSFWEKEEMNRAWRDK